MQDGISEEERQLTAQEIEEIGQELQTDAFAEELKQKGGVLYWNRFWLYDLLELVGIEVE